MPKTIKYIGPTVRWPELAYTGKQSVWQPGQIEQRSDTEAGLLLATGLFSDVDSTLLPEQKVVALSGVVSGAWNPLLSSGGAVNRVLKRFSDAVGVTVANSGTAATHSVATGPWGGLAYKVELGTGNTYTEVQLSGRNIANFDGHVVWRVWVEDYTKFGQISAFAGTSGYTRLHQHNHILGTSDVNRHNGEQYVICGPTRSAATNTFVAGTDTLADFKLRITSGGQNGGVLWIDAVMIPGKGRPTHVITHDDASVTWITEALPILAANGLSGTFGVYTSTLGTNPALFLSTAQVQQIAAAGHQISSHNVTNTAHNDGLSGTQDAATYTADFVAASATLSALIGQAFDGTYHPWVQGKNTQALHDAMRGAGLMIARGVDNSGGYNFPQCGLGRGVLALKTQSLHTMTEAQIRAAVDNTRKYGTTTFWMVHEITANGGVGTETARANYELMCSLIGADVRAGQAVHRTAAQLGRELYAERLVAASLLA